MSTFLFRPFCGLHSPRPRQSTLLGDLLSRSNTVQVSISELSQRAFKPQFSGR